MKNNYNKLKTIPFPNSIEGLYLTPSHDLFVAVNPSNIFHFDARNHKVSKTPVLSLSDNETITAFHSSELSTELNINSCLISSHTGTIYEVIKSKGKKKCSLDIVHQVLSLIFKRFSWIIFKWFCLSILLILFYSYYSVCG